MMLLWFSMLQRLMATCMPYILMKSLVYMPKSLCTYIRCISQTLILIINAVLFREWATVSSGEVRIAQGTAVLHDETQEVENAEFTQTGKETLLFSFDFGNRTNGFQISQGEFHGTIHDSLNLQFS